ncbi:hypothetical protein ABB55_03240 [Prosthecomicrobium hirschii]|uniref:Uncharacterized protein n=1 Tax=Prosthecodimorpha hirschii TaxID=665126 RepID=A0A0N8GEF3_9HYPH|nr:hypothetical protein ABB55_03240 [Prosthecomicrobium hirschii]
MDGRESFIEEPGDAGYISNAGVVYSEIFATMLDAGVELRTGVIHDVQVLIPTPAGFAVGKALDAGHTALLHAAFAGAQPDPGQIGSVEILSISADPVLDPTGIWVGHAVAVFHPAN